MDYKAVEVFGYGEHTYKPGDEFPAPGVIVNQQECDYLASNQNGLNKPVIEFIGVKEEEEVIPGG